MLTERLLAVSFPLPYATLVRSRRREKILLGLRNG